MPRVVRQVSIEDSPRAECTENGCGWSYNSHAETRDRAKNHVRQTGHQVLVESVKRDVYEMRS